MEGICGGTAVCGWIREWPYQLELLDDGTRPAVADDDRQCILVPGTHMDVVDVQTVDFGDVVRLL